MLRSSRALVSLLRSLTFGTAATLASATLVTSVVGCKDESQPEYWVDKLDDAAWRARAIQRLEQFFEDALTKSNKDPNTPEVQALLNKVVDPLTKAYVDNYAELDTKTRVSLIKVLASLRDKRTEPALKKAFDEFAKKPATQKDDADIKWAARAATDLKLPSLGDSLLQAFLKLKAHTMLGGIAYKDVNEAMVAMPQASWGGPLRTALEPVISAPTGKTDAAEKLDDYRDQLFWQTTAAEVLGILQDGAAVEPLLRVILDPGKADVHPTALLALVKIGKPAAERGVKLLKGEDKALVEFAGKRIQELTKSKEAPKDRPYVPVAALVLGTIGRPESIGPMVNVLKTEDKEINKAVIARELAKIPATPQSKEAFKAAFESISLDTTVPPGANALQMLAEAAGMFYDPGMIDWLLGRAEATRGAGDDKKALQTAITITILKLAKPNQLASAKRAVAAYGTQLEKDLYAQVEKLLKACGDRTSCYLAEVEKGENQDQKNQFAGIKAAYMIAMLGNEQSRDELIQRLDAVENAAVRYSSAAAIDYLSPKGSKDAAGKLKTIINKNKQSADSNKIQGDAPLKHVMYRIESRAG
ncbi:MAG TPA: hypothetical protein VK524_26780 [Polyangiaceae bacterium]|nr:hypothetical protein [Polyangiaceae bacterium]